MKILLPALILAITPAFAHAIKVSESAPVSYKHVRIQGEKTKGVSVVLKTEVTRTDCNSISLDAVPANIGGNEFNWYASFFVNTGLTRTEMYCPEKPTKEIIRSLPMKFESYSNPNLDRALEIELVVPVNYEVEVKELK